MRSSMHSARGAFDNRPQNPDAHNDNPRPRQRFGVRQPSGAFPWLTSPGPPRIHPARKCAPGKTHRRIHAVSDVAKCRQYQSARGLAHSKTLARIRTPRAGAQHLESAARSPAQSPARCAYEPTIAFARAPAMLNRPHGHSALCAGGSLRPAPVGFSFYFQAHGVVS